MTEIWIWGLVASLILLAISTSIKATTGTVTINKLNDFIKTLRKEIETIKQEFNETAQKQSIIYAREKDESTKTIAELINQVIYLKAHSVPLTPDMDPRLTYEYTEAFEEAAKSAEKHDKTS